MKLHIRNKRAMTAGRFFLTEKDIASLKHDEDVARSQANREGKPIEGVKHIVCRCGAEGCGWVEPMLSTPIPPKLKPKRSYGYSNMFSGRVVIS